MPYGVNPPQLPKPSAKQAALFASRSRPHDPLDLRSYRRAHDNRRRHGSLGAADEKCALSATDADTERDSEFRSVEHRCRLWRIPAGILSHRIQRSGEARTTERSGGDDAAW